MKKLNCLVAPLCVAIGLITTTSASAALVTLDFQTAPVGVITSPFNISDGFGGFFTIGFESYASAFAYEIRDNGGDRELFLRDPGPPRGGATPFITHSSGMITPVSGGTYRRGAGAPTTRGQYGGFASGFFFGFPEPISTTDLTMSFTPSGPVAKVDAYVFGTSGTVGEIYLDDLRFEVAGSSVPEPSSAILLALAAGVAAVLYRRKRKALELQPAPNAAA